MWKVKVLINKNWRSEHFRPLKEAGWQSYLAVRNPETLEGLSDNFLFVLSIQLHTQKQNDFDILILIAILYLIPCWNQGKTCLKNKQDIIELQVCRWFRPLAITICSAYSALLTGLNVCMKTCNGLINNPTPLAFYTLRRHPKTHNASSKPVVSTVSHSGERIRITSIRQAMPGLWPTRSVFVAIQSYPSQAKAQPINQSWLQHIPATSPTMIPNGAIQQYSPKTTISRGKMLINCQLFWGGCPASF